MGGSSLDDIGLRAWNASNAGDLSVGARDFVPSWGATNTGSDAIYPSEGVAEQGQRQLRDETLGNGGLVHLGGPAGSDAPDGFNEDDMNAKFSSLLFDD